MASAWALVKQMNSYKTIQIQQTAWQEKLQPMINSYGSRARNRSPATHSIFPSDAEGPLPKKLLTQHDAAGALAECGQDSGCHSPRQNLRPHPFHQTSHHTSNFLPLRLSMTSGNLSMTNRDLRQNKDSRTMCECNKGQFIQSIEYQK